MPNSHRQTVDQIRTTLKPASRPLGKTMTLYTPAQKVYATVAAPPTVETTIDFARETIGILLPAADLLDVELPTGRFRVWMDAVLDVFDKACAPLPGLWPRGPCDRSIFTRAGRCNPRALVARNRLARQF